jgi:hypothetical protein
MRKGGVVVIKVLVSMESSLPNASPVESRLDDDNDIQKHNTRSVCVPQQSQVEVE